MKHSLIECSCPNSDYHYVEFNKELLQLTVYTIGCNLCPLAGLKNKCLRRDEAQVAFVVIYVALETIIKL